MGRFRCVVLLALLVQQPLGYMVSTVHATASVSAIHAAPSAGLPSNDPVTGIAAGVGLSMALTRGGRVYAWGANSYGELGIGNTTNSSVPVAVRIGSGGLPLNDPVKAIAAGSGYAMALTSSGRVYAWGDNRVGKLGIGTSNPNCLAATPPAGCFISTPRQVRTGPGGLPSGDPVQAIAAGYSHALALTRSGQLYGWGSDVFGQLGNGNDPQLCVKSVVSSCYSASPAPVRIAVFGRDTITAIVAGSFHSLALTKSGKLYAWGGDQDGQLGTAVLASTSAPAPVLVGPAALPAGDPVTAIAAGELHSAAITRSGVVYGWGANDFGSLGIGSTTNDPQPIAVPTDPGGLPSGIPAIRISSGSADTIAELRDGSLYAWGFNGYGELGNGAVTAGCDKDPTPARCYRTSPVRVRMGPGGLPKDDPVIALSTGIAHVLALTRRGQIYAWGDGRFGELGTGGPTLGIGGTLRSSVPVHVNR